MATILAYNKTTNDVVWSQADSQGQEVSLDMVATALGMKDLPADDYGALRVDEGISPQLALKMKVNGAKDGVYLPENINEEKIEAFNKLKRNYLVISEGIDPVTNQRIYVDCTVGETVYRMDAGRKPAESMDGGVRAIERAVQLGIGPAFMPKVRDFHNNDHLNVPLSVAIAIGLQQGIYAMNLWVAYGEKVDEIKNATTVEEVRNLYLNFDVNVE